ncbi:MAG: cache domain-containing protein [Candidatus Aminicenantes bacterium]|nr:MAG: cache domain-containing protein [Candidatus Aminicenantes bacterium]
MKQINDSTYNMIETTMNTAIKNYLKGIAEKTLGFAKYNYNLYEKGEISEREAYKRLKEYILSPYTVRIGKTGYNSAISGNDGVLEMHPRSERFDASAQEFMQKAMKMKNGYLEYIWKNIDEDKPRKKVGYLLYFEPWDLILWPTAYKDELYELVDPKELTAKLVNIRVRKSGYVSVLDKDAKIIVHPYMPKGLDVKDSQCKKNGKYFIRQMMEHKEGGGEYGTIRYFWRNEGEKEAREKIVYYKHYEKLDWLICSGVYLDELYEPINHLRNILIIISIIVLIFVVLFSIFIGKSVSRPIKQLAEGAEAIGKGKLDVVIRLKSKDEIGLLANTFNEMAKRLKQEMDKVEKASNAKSTFLANMSHEIRTPLTSILGNAELLAAHLRADPNITLLENIKSSTKTLKDFLDDTLHMSRIEARKLKINVAAVNIYSILHEIRNNFSFQIS